MSAYSDATTGVSFSFTSGCALATTASSSTVVAHSLMASEIPAVGNTDDVTMFVV